MKKVFLTVVLVGLTLITWSQENKNFSQFFLTPALVNPAFTGIEDFLDIKVGHRKQWRRIDDPPQTNYFGLFGVTYRDDPASYRDNSLRVSNPTIYEKYETIRRELYKHGFGAYLIVEDQGPFNQVDFNGAYALHIPLSNKLRLTMGTTIGILSTKINVDEFTLRDPDNDLFYQSLLDGNTSETNLRVSMGWLLHGQKFYFGISALPIINTPISNNNFEDGDFRRNYNFQAGTRIRINNDLEYLPSLLFSVQNIGLSTYDINMRVRYKEIVWAGMSYRSNPEMSLMFGVFYKRFNFNYSYDIALSAEDRVNSATHELLLGVAVFKKKLSSRYMW